MRKFVVNVNGSKYEIEVDEISVGEAAATAVKSESVKPAQPVEAPKQTAVPVVSAGNGTKIESPMPGTILAVNKKAGDTVKAGDAIIILEAMKMENEILAPIDGKIIAIRVQKGATVESGELLAIIA